MFAPVGRSTAPAGGCACVDLKAADGTALQIIVHDDLLGAIRHRTLGEQFGRSDQKDLREFMKMPSGQRDRESDRLRNRAAGRGASDERYPPTVQDF